MNDRVDSVRSAAIESLASQVSSPAVAAQLMDSLQRTSSPLVQLALIDLILRHGNDYQRDDLLSLANEGLLHPDLEKHVLTSLGGNTI